MSTKTELVQELLCRAEESGHGMSVSRARRLVARALNEPDPLAYVLTYWDPVGEAAVRRC